MSIEVKPEEGEKVYRTKDVNELLPDGKKVKNATGNTVNFKVEHNDKVHKGQKYMKDGDVHKGLHILHAQQLEKLGCGKIIK